MAPPTHLGRYEVVSLLGQGGMGAVYKARDPALDRVVALKTINPVLLAGGELRDEYLERFRREARAAGRLSHPHIVSVYDLGFDEAGATPFIVMEYVAGVSLETLLKENPTLPVTQALEMVEQIASALDEAHRHGVVHRDIKPANVFVDPRGRVKVGDFGVARLEGSELTQAGVSFGTPGYAAPEVVRGGTADVRSDVFALGVLAYRLLAGKRAFSGATREAVAIDILEREPPPPQALRAEVPEHVSAAVMRTLAKSPEARTPTAGAFLQELNVSPGAEMTASVVSRPLAATPMSSPTRPLPGTRGRRRGLVVAALIAVALALGAGAFLVTRAGPTEQPRGVAATPAARRPGSARETRGSTGSPPRTASPRPIESEPPEEADARVPTRPRTVDDKAWEIATEAAKKIWERSREAQERDRERDKKADEKKREEGKKGREKGKKDKHAGNDP
jgi:eukaryotic-like serine/threonine-protein kinase